MTETELQLGLSLLPPTSNPSSSSSSSSPSVDGYDRFEYSPKHILLASMDWGPEDTCGNGVKMTKKRMFDDIIRDSVARKTTLPLLWNNGPNDGDNNRAFGLADDEGEEEEGVVGWPPIKAWRKRLCCDVSGWRSESGNRTVENGCSCGARVAKFMYVKVKMEGVAIARKVDLSVHTCFETLFNTLMNMFGIYHEDRENFKLTYQDREGDWLLAQDVSWRKFIRSVQRLKLVARNH